MERNATQLLEITSYKVNLQSYDLVFTHDLKSLLLVPMDSTMPVDRVPLDSWESGVLLVIDRNAPNMLLVSKPATLLGTFYREFLPLREQFTAITFNPDNGHLWAGGIGIIDIVDTDPLGVVALEIPLYGTVPLPFDPAISGDIKGVVIRVGIMDPISITIQGVPDPVSFTQAPIPIMAFDVYYNEIPQ
jgi:hypothetical protein